MSEAPVNTQIGRDYSITAPTALAIAEQLVSSKSLRGKSTPRATDLAEMITGVGEQLTLKGAPQLQLNLLDPVFALLESGFWEVDKNGRLGEIELNYPEGSKYWWRLRQVSPRADFTVETYWIPRVVRKLMDLHGPVKASRGSRTRAQFLEGLTKKVPEARFHSKQLNVKQPIKPIEHTKSEKEKEKQAKDLTVTGPGAKGLTVKGSPITDSQRAVASQLLQVCDQAAAGAVPTIAMIYAAIWESALDPKADNGNYWGVLSASHSNIPQSHTTEMAEAFLHGGKGFKSAIDLTSGAHGLTNPAEVASQAEGAIPYDQNGVSQQYHAQSGYPGDEAAVAEAEAIVVAGGGASGTGGITGGTAERIKQYNFEVGTTDEPHEDYWTAMVRIAEEVNWELVVDGPDIYYDSDITLTRAGLVDIIERTDENIIDWSYDWDDREVVTNFSITLVCDEFAYKGGDALKVEGFGPASDGSTIKLPGRWLVGESQRSPGDISATLTLIQPTKPLKEPAPETESANSAITPTGVPEGFPAAESGQYRNPPTQGPKGTANFEGTTVAKWIVPQLEYARKKDPTWKITSGFRPGPDPHTATGASEHQGEQYPHGAIDFGGYTPNPSPDREAFFKASEGFTGLVVIPAQFAGDGGHASGTGH